MEAGRMDGAGGSSGSVPSKGVGMGKKKASAGSATTASR